MLLQAGAIQQPGQFVVSNQVFQLGIDDLSFRQFIDQLFLLLTADFPLVFQQQKKLTTAASSEALKR